MCGNGELKANSFVIMHMEHTTWNYVWGLSRIYTQNRGYREGAKR